MSFILDTSSSQSNPVSNEVNPAPDVENVRKRSLREKTRQAAARVQRLKNEQKFLGDFDPEKSKREKRKLKRKITAPTSSRYSVYDEKGRFRDTLLDICDCLNAKCPGCFFPCPNCKCNKCGPSCRVNRKVAYELIEFDGNNDIIRNHFQLFRK